MQDNQTPPAVTPEMYQEFQQAPQQGYNQVPQAPAPQPPQAYDQAPPPQQTYDESIAQVGKDLGLEEMKAQMQQLQRATAQDTVSKKFPNVTYEIAEKEIEAMAGVNPQFAEQMRTDPTAMEFAFRAAQAKMTPTKAPDNLTDNENGGGQGESALSEIRAGTANDGVLGEYLLSMEE